MSSSKVDSATVVTALVSMVLWLTAIGLAASASWRMAAAMIAFSVAFNLQESIRDQRR